MRGVPPVWDRRGTWCRVSPRREISDPSGTDQIFPRRNLNCGLLKGDAFYSQSPGTRRFKTAISQAQ